MGILSSLPNRLLSVPEAEGLMEQDSSIDILPYSFIDGMTVASLLVMGENHEKIFILGFNPEEEGWERVGAWTEDDWSQQQMEDEFMAWSNRVFDEDQVKTDMVDIDP